MLIKDLFTKPVSRPINGVIKADQFDDDSVWQELDEYVITRELDIHLRNFIGAYLEAIDNKGNSDISGKVGIWVSGFFGSGKSHFIKILSYLLENREVSKNTTSKKAIEFFDGKIQDAMLAGDIKRAVGSDCDVILFNIDSKADSTEGRDAILRVFLKVLNEKLGYSGDHPHIAHMERYLDGEGKLDQFKEAFRKTAGTDWVEERDAYHFHADELVAALSETLGQSREATNKWLDKSEEDFHLTVENFAGWVKEYLDSRGPDHRVGAQLPQRRGVDRVCKHSLRIRNGGCSGRVRSSLPENDKGRLEVRCTCSDPPFLRKPGSACRSDSGKSGRGPRRC